MEPTTADLPAPAALFTPSGYARLFATTRGRVFHLSWMAHAEETDEGVFDRVLSSVEIPDVHKMIQRHADDEKRHADLLRGCVTRLGFSPQPIPPELHYIQRLRRISGGDLGAVFASGPFGIMQIFAMLQVVEERGVRQFPLVADALRPFDPESAAVIAAITRDEERHVKYARAVSQRYAPDPHTLDQVLAVCR